LVILPTILTEGSNTMSEGVPADPINVLGEVLDDPIEDRLRDTRSVAELVTTDQESGGSQVPTEPVDLMATAGAITFDCWRMLAEPTKEAWRHVVRIHGFDPSDVAFPLVIDGDTMIVRQYLRNADGQMYLNEARDDVATQDHEVRLQTEVGLPARCRDGDGEGG
jgi:hypothetical protein